MAFLIDAGNFLGQGALRAGSWIRGGGWKVLAIVFAALLSAFAIRSCTIGGAKIEAAQVALKSAQGENAILSRSNSAADGAVTRNQAAKAALLAQETEELARTQAALAGNPDWASQPIPPDILDSLRQ